jgi:hypothetical protein
VVAVAAVDVERLAVDETRLGAGEVRDALGDVLRLSSTAYRLLRDDLVEEPGLLALEDALRGDEPRRDGVARAAPPRSRARG